MPLGQKNGRSHFSNQRFAEIVDGGIGANISEWLLHFRNRCFVKLKIGRHYFLFVVVSRNVRHTNLLDIGVVVTSRHRQLHRFLSCVDKAMTNQIQGLCLTSACSRHRGRWSLEPTLGGGAAEADR